MNRSTSALRKLLLGCSGSCVLVAAFLVSPLGATTFLPLTVNDLVTAVQAANSNQEPDTIDLGGQVFSLTAIDNVTDGNNGLPSVLDDNGNSLRITNGVLERDLGALSGFRFLHVSAGGDLTLDLLELRNGLDNNGGAVYNLGALVVDQVVFSNNTAQLSGGAVLNVGVASISRSTFSGNVSSLGGGAVTNNGTIGSVLESTFDNNTALGGGGAISNGGTISSIVQCTFSGNSAAGGGAIHNAGDSAIIDTIANSTVAGNVASESGGGILNDGLVSTLQSTIAALNLSPDSPDIDNAGTIVTESFNLVGDGSGSGLVAGTPNANSSYVGTVVTPIDPLLGPLADNGGPTDTRELLAGSPAIDLGSNPLALAFDQRGTPFPRDFGLAPDIGAFEVVDLVFVGITKDDAPDPVPAGTNLVYTITVTHGAEDTDPVDASDVSWTDTLPAGTTFVSLAAPAGWSCNTPAVGSGGTVTCSIATLAPESSEVFTLTVAVDAGLGDGSVLSNTATVTATLLDQAPVEQEANADTTVIVRPMTVTKLDSPDPVFAGANLVYTIAVNNHGSTDASTVAWSDTLPAGTTFVSLGEPAGWACTTPAVGSGGSVDCSIATLGPGTAQFTLTVAVDPSVAGGSVLSNTASLTATVPNEPPVDEEASADTTVVNSAVLSISKVDSPDPVIAGTNLEYTVTVTNAGPSSTGPLSLDDSLPAGTTFVSLSEPAGWTCSTPLVGDPGSVSCSIASLAAGSAVFTLTVEVDSGLAAGTVLTNTAVVSTTSNPDDDDFNAVASTTVVGPPDLAITKTDGVTSVEAGATLVYTIVASNAGPSDALDAQVTDAFPPALTCTWTCLGENGGVCAAASGSGSIVDTVDLPNGGSVTYTVTCDVADSAFGTISNTATVTAPAGVSDTDQTNNSATDLDDVIAGAEVTGTKTASGTYQVGQTVTYTVVLTNVGVSPQADNTGDELVDVLPPELELVDATATSGTAVATPATNTVTWNGSLAADDSVTITITATILASAAGGIVSNQGTIAVDSDGDLVNDSSVLTDDPSVGGRPTRRRSRSLRSSPRSPHWGRSPSRCWRGCSRSRAHGCSPAADEIFR